MFALNTLNDVTWYAAGWNTGKSFSEALILAPTNPQYDKKECS